MSARHVPRIALTRQESADALGVGLTTFKERIAPELRVIREGKVRIYLVRDLEQWADENAERVIGVLRPLFSSAARLRESDSTLLFSRPVAHRFLLGAGGSCPYRT